MKRHRGFLLDDENTFKMFLEVLANSFYLIRSKEGAVFSPTFDEDKKGWNKIADQCIDVRCVTAEYQGSRGIGWSFSEAFEYLCSSKEDFDFFVFDLQLQKSPLNPLSVDSSNERLSLCNEARKYEWSKDKPERYILTEVTAGLSFVVQVLNLKRPCIIYSAVDKTRDVRDLLKLVAGDLPIYIVNVSSSNVEAVERKTVPDDSSLKAALEGLDSYLRRRQTEVVNMLTGNERDTLVSRINQIVRNNTFDQADIADIPDRRDAGQDFWSLRSLFPKQINIIQYRQDETEIKCAVDEVSRILKADWRELMSIGILNHPASEKPYIYHWTLDAARELTVYQDFEKVKKTQGYKQLSQLPEFSDDTESLRNLIAGGGQNSDHYMVNYRPYSVKKSCADYFSGLPSSKEFEFDAVVDWFLELGIWSTNFGIYPFDLAYISHIVYQNSHHQNGASAKDILFAVRRTNESVSLLWRYPEIVPLRNLGRMSDKLNDANDCLNILQDEGYGDIGRIVCWRYRGAIKLESENARLLASWEGGEIRARIDKAQENKTLPQGSEGGLLTISIAKCGGEGVLDN